MSIEIVKLINDKGDVIERYKHDYENNIERFNMRGWKLHDGKTPKAEPVKEEVVEEDAMGSKKLLKKL